LEVIDHRDDLDQAATPSALVDQEDGEDRSHPEP
jgi:hypothetical protein